MDEERLTQEDVVKLLGTVRTFYRENRDPNDFGKSDNKIYLYPQTEKAHRLNDSLLSTGDKIQALQEFLYEKNGAWSDFERGRHIVENKISFGNCTEMSLAATYLCAKDESFARKVKHTWLALTTPGSSPGNGDNAPDHVFVLISDNLSVSRKELTIKILEKAPAETGLWVIDPWFNIACSARDYSTHIGQKLEKWDGLGKAIGASLDESRKVVPPDNYQSEEFDAALKSSRLTFRYVLSPKLQHNIENAPSRASNIIRQPSQGHKRR